MFSNLKIGTKFIGFTVLVVVISVSVTFFATLYYGTATIFMRDVRVSTNALTRGDDRAVGTKLQGPACDAIFKAGTSYRGEAPAVGKPYFTAYDPLKNAKGDVISVLYVGIPKAELFRAYDCIAFIVAGIALLLVGVRGQRSIGEHTTERRCERS
jgi:hypothetical protein